MEFRTDLFLKQPFSDLRHPDIRNFELANFQREDYVTNIKQHIKIEDIHHRTPCGGKLYVYYNNGSFQINRKSRNSNDDTHLYLIGSVQREFPSTIYRYIVTRGNGELFFKSIKDESSNDIKCIGNDKRVIAEIRKVIRDGGDNRLSFTVTANDLVYYQRVLVLIIAILLYSDFYTEGNTCSPITTKNSIIIIALTVLFIIGISGTTSFAWW